VTTTQRATQLPDVPTAQEAGFKGYEASAWYAIVAPTGTPKEVISKLNGAVNEFLKSDKGRVILEQNTLQSVGGGPEVLKEFIDSELAKWAPVIKAAKIQM
jgi:tripartite-type tricarboxylate transporter receptor subunit TctC